MLGVILFLRIQSADKAQLRSQLIFNNLFNSAIITQWVKLAV